MTEAPLVLLDVDGVLNAVCSLNYLPDCWSDWRDQRMNGFAITWAPALVERINAWIEAGAEVRWLTTWRDLANEHIGPRLGLPTFPVEQERDEAHLYELQRPTARSQWLERWWKLGLVEAIATENPDRNIVWIDDDLAFDQEAQDFIREKNDMGHGQIQGIAPETRVGVTPVLCDVVDAFIAKHAAPVQLPETVV